MIEKTVADLQGLIRVALGEEPPDLVVTNVRIFDVFSGRLFEGSIWIRRAWIAYVGEREPFLGEATVCIDGGGRVAVPGYIDAHGHADLFYNPSSFADFVVTRGSTTVFSDGHDMINSVGIGGFLEILRKGEGFAVKYLWGIPAASPPYPEMEGGELFSLDEIDMLFEASPDCASISELSSYIRVLRGEEEILKRILCARAKGRNVEGHTLGASYDRLNALVAAGLTSCHESVREIDLLNRLRLGLYTMIRHSSIRSDFSVLVPLIRDIPKDYLMLVSDGIFAHDLGEKGYMDHVISAAIGFGLDPADAIRMSTINPARYFKKDSEIGSVAPGRIGDILLLDGLDQPTPRVVIERGRVVAENGNLLVPSTPFPQVLTTFHPYRIDEVRRPDVTIPATDEEPVPVISIVDRTVTKRIDMELPLSGRNLCADRDRDVRKIVYSRRDRPGWGKGFLKGFGARFGGIATTIAHETHGLLVLGFDDGDMCSAANEVLTMAGGIVIADGGKIVHRLAMPHGATMSDLSVGELAVELKRINQIMQDAGSTLDDPLWTMGFLTFTSIVELRITCRGVYDVRKGVIVF